MRVENNTMGGKHMFGCDRLMGLVEWYVEKIIWWVEWGVTNVSPFMAQAKHFYCKINYIPNWTPPAAIVWPPR